MSVPLEEQVSRRSAARHAVFGTLQVLLSGLTDLDHGDVDRFERAVTTAEGLLAGVVNDLCEKGSLS